MIITEFIRARLDEEEQTAQAAAGSDVEAGFWTLSDATATQVRDGNGYRVGGHTWPHKGAHIVLHDPARVLREVNMKKRMIEDLDYGGGEMGDAQGQVIRQLASVYSDHPDYDQKWAP